MIACDTLQAHEDLYVTVDKEPAARFFGKTAASKLVAVVCGTCGFTELYARDFQRLAAPAK
jgi:predicted nucleic-acid-binding Zn-ribbon protein